MALKTSDLLDFYYTELYPELQELEKERLRVKRQVIWSVVIIAAIALALMKATYGTTIDAPFYIAGVALLFGTGVVNGLISSYRKRFKSDILGRLVARIDPKLVYQPFGMVSKNLFQRSGLFGTDFDHYEGHDLIHGRIGETPLRLSNLKVEKDSGKPGRRRQRVTIFSGTFIVTEFHKTFHHTLKIYPDVAEKYMGVVGGWLQGTGSGVVRLDSPAFEKEFKVIADDPVEAHYLLTPNIMEKLVRLRRKADAPVYLSFRRNQLFIAIDNGGGWFEPTLFKSLLRVDVFRNYVENLNLVLGIVEDLNLNRRIWSKE